MTRLLYLDQNYLSGIAKGKAAFRDLAPALRDAIARGALGVAESAVHERESAPRPDLRLLELLRGLSGGRRQPAEPDAAGREVRRRMAWTIEHELSGRRADGGRRPDVLALRDRLAELTPEGEAA